MTKVIVTPEEIAEAAKSALENWDFQVYIDNGETPEDVKQKRSPKNGRKLL